MAKIEILDPVAPRRPPRQRPALRLAELRGKRLGLLFNGKPGGLEIMEALRDRLVAEWDVKPVGLLRKKHASAPAEAAALAALARQSDFIITALGD